MFNLLISLFFSTNPMQYKILGFYIFFGNKENKYLIDVRYKFNISSFGMSGMNFILVSPSMCFPTIFSGDYINRWKTNVGNWWLLRLCYYYFWNSHIEITHEILTSDWKSLSQLAYVFKLKLNLSKIKEKYHAYYKHLGIVDVLLAMIIERPHVYE